MCQDPNVGERVAWVCMGMRVSELDPTGNIYCKYQLHVKFNTVFTHDSKSVWDVQCCLQTSRDPPLVSLQTQAPYTKMSDLEKKEEEKKSKIPFPGPSPNLHPNCNTRP